MSKAGSGPRSSRFPGASPWAIFEAPDVPSGWDSWRCNVLAGHQTPTAAGRGGSQHRQASSASHPLGPQLLGWAWKCSASSSSPIAVKETSQLLSHLPASCLPGAAWQSEGRQHAGSVSEQPPRQNTPRTGSLAKYRAELGEKTAWRCGSIEIKNGNLQLLLGL